MGNPERRQSGTTSTRAIADSFDVPSCSLASLSVEPAARYVVQADPHMPPRQATWVTAHTKSVTAAENSPRVAAPTTAVMWNTADRYSDVLWHLEMAAGQAATVEVWAHTEIVSGTWSWLLVDRISVVEAYREYRAPGRFRPLFFRVTNTVGVTVPAPVQLRAAGI